MHRTRCRALTLFFTLYLTAACGLAQAASSADAKPPKVQWQRTLKDALALAKKHQLPLLIAVNQDGEPACEALNRGRYRSDAFASMAGRYVAVIASPNRHTPKDYDSQGRRILCPRFGCVTCGEHRDIEPKLYEAYFNGRRVAPRHIGIGPDGKRLFDRFLDQSLNAIDEALRRHADMKSPAPKLTATSRDLKDLMRSRADQDRRAVEAVYDRGDAMRRIEVLTTAAASGIDHPALVRRGLTATDPDVRKAARLLLVRTADANSLNTILISMGTADNRAEFAALMPALRKIAKSDNKNAVRALEIREALLSPSTLLSLDRWREWLKDAPDGPELVPNEELAQLDAKIEAATKRARAEKSGAAWQEVGEATFRYALNRMTAGRDPTFLLMDADRALVEATKNGVNAATVAPLRARTLWMQNKRAEAGVEAVRALAGDSPPAATYGKTHTALQVLRIFAATQQDILYQPLQDGAPYPKARVANIHAAHQLITAHPAATPTQSKAHFDFLLYLGARFASSQAILRGLQRFPGDATVHQYFRNQASFRAGTRGLETCYDDLQKQGSNATLDWFAGYSCLLGAEGYAKAKAPADARRAYEKTLRNMARSAQSAPGFRDSANHYAALAYGGLAQLAWASRDLPSVERYALLGARIRPGSFASPDGLGNNLQRTARRLRRRLKDEAKAAFEKKIADLGLSFEPQ